MSYARIDLSQSQVFKNACNSIRTSPKYKGFSIVAAEYLLAALRSRPNVSAKINTRGQISWVSEVQKKYPADYWLLMTKKRRSQAGDDEAVKLAARRTIQMFDRLKGRKCFLTFKGRKFQISHLAVGLSYIQAMVPRGEWKAYPWRSQLYRQIKDYGRAEFRYATGNAVFEVVE